MSLDPRRLLAVAAGLLVVLTGCAGTAATSPGGTPSATEVTVGLSYIPNVQFAPFYLAEADGTLGEGVVLRHHGSSEGLFTAIATGEEDFVLAGGDEALQAREQGLDLVSIATYYPSYPVRIIVNESSDATTIADLEGQRIGVPGRYGESWFGLLVGLAEAGLSLDDVTVVEIGYTQQAALTTGKVDAVVGFANNDLVQFQAAGVAVRALPLVDEGEPPLVSISLLTTGDFLAANRDVAAKVAAGMVSGINAAVADPSGALDVTATQVPDLDRDAAAVTLEATLALMAPGGSATGQVDVALWQQMAKTMLAAGLLTAEADVEAATAPDVMG